VAVTLTFAAFALYPLSIALIHRKRGGIVQDDFLFADLLRVCHEINGPDYVSAAGRMV
jgi:hypothetical protein